METSALDISAILAVAFGMWAGVVAWIGNGVLKRLDQISIDLRHESARLNSYIVQTERRLSVVEDRLKINHE
jgi:hypothetical protein